MLPVGVPEPVWLSLSSGDRFKVYSDGGIKDQSGASVPGNWGTLDVGDTNNSTMDISEQIEIGLRQSDLDELYDDDRIATNEYIDTTQPFLAQGETGMSIGIRDSVQSIHGTTTYIPIFDSVTNNGNTANYRIVAWGTVKVVTSEWNGNHNTYITLEKMYTYDRELRPIADLSSTSGTIDGAFTTPVLVE